MVATRLMSADELLALPDDGYQHELIWGELKRMPPAGGDATYLGARFVRRVGNSVEDADLGFFSGADGGFRLARDPDVVLAPDAGFVRWARMPPKAEWKGYVPVAPDLAIEVVSPSATKREVAAKVALYLQLGTGTVWVVDEGARTVAIHRANEAPTVLRVGDVLDGGALLPGFSWALADIFR